MVQISVNIGSGNGLLPDGTKPFPEPLLNLSLVRIFDIHRRAILLLVPKLLFSITSLKITFSELQKRRSWIMDIDGLAAMETPVH